MTMQPSPPYAHLTLEQYHTIVAAETARLAALAALYGAEAIGRDYPRHITRYNGCRYAVAGKWYLVHDGKRRAATASQARALNAAYETGGVSSIGPISAA